MALRPPRPASGSPDLDLIRLRRCSRTLWVAASVSIFGAVTLLATHGGWPAAVRWAAPTAAVWSWILIRLERLLELNHHPAGNRLRPSLGAANTLTLGRAAVVGVLAGCLFQDPLLQTCRGGLAWAPGGLYLAVTLLDAGDGWIARATGGETRLGEVLDTEVDAMGLLMASLLLVSSGKAPLVFLSVGLGYYVVGAARRLRSWRGHAVGKVQPRATARLIAGCQMGFAAAALLPVFDPAATFPAAFVMTAAFGLSMGMDWLVICGLATPDGRLLLQWLAAWQATGTRLLPLFLRTATLISVVLFTLKPWRAGETVLPLAGILLLGLLCLLGLAARLAAMLLSILMAFLLSAGGHDAVAELTLAAALALMMTGAGRPRIWQPEDTLFTKKRP